MLNKLQKQVSRVVDLILNASVEGLAHLGIWLVLIYYIGRGGSRAAATSKMERFVIIVNGFQPGSGFHCLLIFFFDL